MKPFFIQREHIHLVPVLHYTMETAMHVREVFLDLKPDCVAVELPETLQLPFLHAASRLPDVTVLACDPKVYFLAEPCDASFEALRSALEAKVAAYCIDLDIADYPHLKEPMPDPYAIAHIGLESYYEAYKHLRKASANPLDEQREWHIAKRLKELTFRYDNILYVGGFFHIESILQKLTSARFPEFSSHPRSAQICTLTETSCREVLAEPGFFSLAYENWRANAADKPERQKLLFSLYKEASEIYKQESENVFPGYHFRNLMKFVRNLAHIHGRLMPNLYEILLSAQGCVNHNFAYETWKLATHFPHWKNVDNLPELDLKVEDIWGVSKHLRFHLKEKTRKGREFRLRKKDLPHPRFFPPGPFSICSYPPEDIVVERLGDTLKKKGELNLKTDERTLPFLSSLEDGIDAKETIRHWFEKKLFVKLRTRPRESSSSVVIIFDDKESSNEKYLWRTTWTGEHTQESDMAFFATHPKENVVGPGISKCRYGGFLLSSPPRRLFDIWRDPDYSDCESPAETLLMAAIDYAVKPIIIYVAEKPPKPKIKTFAAKFGKKISYLPIGSLSPIRKNQIQFFHVLDGHDKRKIAGDYIF